MTEFIRLKLSRPEKDLFDTDVVIVNKDYISVFVPKNGAILINGLGFCYVDPDQREQVRELLGVEWSPPQEIKVVRPEDVPPEVAEKLEEMAAAIPASEDFSPEALKRLEEVIVRQAQVTSGTSTPQRK